MGNAKKGRARKRAAGSTAAAKRGTRNAAAAKEDPVLPKPPLSWHAVLSFFVVLAAAVTFSIYTWDFLRKMFNTRFTWDLLDATDKRLGRATYSESSLYFTFLEEYASAPTVADAIYGVIRDNKTEYPDVINPMSRFNIWQEVIIGQLWRSGLKEYVADPLDLMIESIWVMQCFSFVGMIILAWYLGGANFFSLACGFVAIATYANIAATERLNCFRAVQFPMLRENYSVPFMWYQLVAVCASLRAGARNTLPRTLWTTSNFALFVSSALMLTGWQFAPFLVLLQVGALLATYIGGYVSLKTVANICTVIVRSIATVSCLSFPLERCSPSAFSCVCCIQAAAMLFVGAVLTMGNIMLLTAPALFVIAAVKVAARYVPTQQSRVETSFAAGLLGLVKRLGLVLVLVLVAFVIKFVVVSLLGMQDDAHIMNILKFKLSGFATAYEDFQTLLYVCSGAYQIMKWEDILFLQEMEQLPTRVVCIIAATVLVAIIELRRLSPRQKSLDVALVFAAANGILLAGLLALIQRLSSVGVPFLCILVAQAASPNHFASVAGAITGPASIEAKTEESNDSTAQASLKISSKSRSNPASKKDKSHKATAPTSSRSLLKLAFLGIGLAVGAWCGQNAYNSFNTALETATPKTQSPVTPRISNDMKVRLIVDRGSICC